MQQCLKCKGLVPETSSSCPHCRAAPKWWSLPLTIAGGAMAAVTLSACYGPACATTVKLPDGGTTSSYGGNQCNGYYDCTATADGGVPVHDAEWQSYCTDSTNVVTDGGADAGTDGGTHDAGTDGGVP